MGIQNLEDQFYVSRAFWTFQILFYTIYTTIYTISTMFLTSKSKYILNAGHHLTICFPLWMTVCSLIAKKCSNEASTTEITLRSLLCPEKKKLVVKNL